MADIKIPTSFNIDLEFESADIMKRFLAWLIDFAIRAGYILVVYMALLSFRPNWSGFDVLFFLLVLFPVVLYFPIMEISMHGKTPGKRITQLQVVSMMGNPPSVSQHLIRWIFRLVESPLGAFALVPVIVPTVAIVRTPYNQRLGDIVAGTIVISTKRKGSIEDTIFRDMSNTDYQPQFPQIMKLSDRDMNKVKDLLDRALKANDEVLASRVAHRVKEVLHIETGLSDTHFLETVLNDYNYYTTKEH
ncbi:putative RDD family membrane protein YckC [Chitinophaga polysaccharea]|uniref:Putative RDD family membrane protein YckC n=1 Tax=Chitinophaga polysaccharea TaxID=1293035 RepID=A0A561PGZ9_9BACT|nr:RDD family protein [Chitinophaga polysaccharea]TWF37392.1 putative RDD family membrane protein YckC [Chitinophaga polysaccharea]